MVGRVLAASVALHLAVGVALARLRPPPAARGRGPIELTVMAPPSRVEAPPHAEAPPRSEPPPRSAPSPHAMPPRTASASRPRVATLERAQPAPAARAIATPSPLPAREPAPPPHPSAEPPRAPVSLFAPSALASAADIAMAPSAADRAWRPRHGVGGEGGIDVGSFLAEDAARQRADKGAVAPELRAAERRLDAVFAPTFGQTDISNRAELFFKQFRGFLRDPPKTGALKRGLDPTQETLDDKMRSRDLDRAFFLGRRVEIFVRQRADGSILEMALRNPSGYRAFDDAALAAVEKALAGRAPGVAHDGEVRTLWQLDATAYVVVSPNPELVFDEASGKSEWRYPLQKRVDHHVRLVAVY